MKWITGKKFKEQAWIRYSARGCPNYTQNRRQIFRNLISCFYKLSQTKYNMFIQLHNRNKIGASSLRSTVRRLIHLTLFPQLHYIDNFCLEIFSFYFAIWRCLSTSFLPNHVFETSWKRHWETNSITMSVQGLKEFQ